MIDFFLNHIFISLALLFVVGYFLYAMAGLFFLYKDDVSEHKQRRRYEKNRKLKSKRITKFSAFWTEDNENEYQKNLQEKIPGELSEIEMLIRENIETQRNRHFERIKNDHSAPLDLHREADTK